MTSPYHPTSAPVEVLHEDAHLLVAVKPANLLTVPGRGPEKKIALNTAYLNKDEGLYALPIGSIKIHQAC